MPKAQECRRQGACPQALPRARPSPGKGEPRGHGEEEGSFPASQHKEAPEIPLPGKGENALPGGGHPGFLPCRQAIPAPSFPYPP